MEVNINTIISLTRQNLDTYGPELEAFLYIKQGDGQPGIKDYELLEARRRMLALANAIDEHFDE